MMEERARCVDPEQNFDKLSKLTVQDGLSIICIILRNIDAESIDYDTLLYCYLKVCGALGTSPEAFATAYTPIDCQSLVAPAIRAVDRCDMLHRPE